MQISGKLQKMRTSLAAMSNQEIEYQLLAGSQSLLLNPLIGQQLTLQYDGEIRCVHCDRKTNKSFSQGYCYPCFSRLAQCDSCIISPEKCHYDAGTCREPDWGERFCMQDHYVYLANSSNPKVGITRGSQIPTRWIDQGAVAALPLFRTSTRYYAGLVEVAYKAHIADKTNWRAMLKGEPEWVDLQAVANDLQGKAAKDLEAIQQQFGLQSVQACDAEMFTLRFPVAEYPEKVTSLSFDKTPEISGLLKGIKGQYLILDSGVLNIRKFGGYRVTVSH